MVYAANLGYPRIGFKRELKVALEKFWRAEISEAELLATGKELRLSNWHFQSTSNLDFIPSNDFSLYDHVLDTIAMVGAVPSRFGWSGGTVDLKTYFMMARGMGQSTDSVSAAPHEAHAMEMTKWFNTNYHFIVPELEEGLRFSLSSNKCIDEFIEARDAGIHTRPVLLGPVSFLYLAKGHLFGHDSTRLENLLDVYCQVLSRLKEAGADWIQLDEPILSLDLTEDAESVFEQAYARLSLEKLSIMLTSYFAPMGDNLAVALRLPVQGLHVDLVHGRQDLDLLMQSLPQHMLLSAGVVDGRNIWRADLNSTVQLLEEIAGEIGHDRLVIAPSCSLIHVPIDVNAEAKMNPEVRSWLAFAEQKIQELSILADALSIGRQEVQHILDDNSKLMLSASSSELRNNKKVRELVESVTPEMHTRASVFEIRSSVQQSKFNLPLFPTTTIGSFPQTKDIRGARQQLRTGKITEEQYQRMMQDQIKSNIEKQENIGLDVLVHGEPERTDMVEYFAEMLDGMAVTQHGWVQSYGSRCVRAPIIYGNVARSGPMTLPWAIYAQNLTKKPVKGMLTGPVTILQWSFVRNDQKRSATCMELALAIRDEVSDLEAAGINIIQIDEPAIREGLPLKRSAWNDYLDWSVKCFKVSSCVVKDETQIHTHMCYAEFGDMVEAIAAMDADVISIEASRSNMELLDSLGEVKYPNAIGPGVYDIHSPRIPTRQEMFGLLEKALRVVPSKNLWVNPDCGLKTRGWAEVLPALSSMVNAAIDLRLLQHLS